MIYSLENLDNQVPDYLKSEERGNVTNVYNFRFLNYFRSFQEA